MPPDSKDVLCWERKLELLESSCIVLKSTVGAAATLLLVLTYRLQRKLYDDGCRTS
jgi:hypothetical protein